MERVVVVTERDMMRKTARCASSDISVEEKRTEQRNEGRDRRREVGTWDLDLVRRGGWWGEAEAERWPGLCGLSTLRATSTGMTS